MSDPVEIALIIDSAINAMVIVDDLVEHLSNLTGMTEEEARTLVMEKRASRETDIAQWKKEREEYYATKSEGG